MGLSSKIPYMIACALAVLAVICAIVGASGTKKGWFKAESNGVKTEIGTMKSCSKSAIVSGCCNLDDCLGIFPDNVVKAAKAALALCIIGIVLTALTAIAAILRIIGFGGKSMIRHLVACKPSYSRDSIAMIALGILTSLLGFVVLTAAWAVYLGIFFKEIDENNGRKPDADYALILTAIGGFLSLFAMFFLAYKYAKHDS